MGSERGTSEDVEGSIDRNVLSVSTSETGYQREHVCVCMCISVPFSDGNRNGTVTFRME